MAAAETRPFAPFEWMLALRYLRARRKEGFISVIAGFSFIGIMLGVATLIIVMSVMNGFRKELFDKILGLNGHGIIRPLGRDFTDYRESAQRLQAVAGVKAAIPVVEGQVLMTTPAASGGVYVRGIREADLRKLEGVSSKVVAGSLDGFDGGNGIAIGNRLASTLKVGVGGAVSLVSRAGGSDSLPSETATRVRRYPVRAIFQIGMAEYDMTIGFLPLGEAQKYFNLPDVAHVLEVFVDDPDSIDTMRRPLLTASGPDMLMTDWRERNASFHNMLQVQRDVLFLILTLIVLVAALNIISGLIMLVKDKGRDIAILRTMGATRGAMMRVFFVTGASIGIAGTLGGLLLGVLVSLNIDSIRQFLSWVTATDLFPSTIYFLSYLPAKVDAGEVASIVIMAISLSMLATLYPSWRAARLEPVEALRYE